MFKLQPNPTFKAMVPITVPGVEKPARIDFEFKYMPGDALGEFFQGLRGKTDLEAVSAIVVGWSGVDEAFSKDALGTLLNNYPSAASAIFETYRNELFEARRKN